MVTKEITEKMGFELVQAADLFSAAIQKALDDALKLGLPESWKITWNVDDTDSYPQRDFKDKALVILGEYRTELLTALEALQAGDWSAIWRVAKMYKGLSKQMDYNFDWMTKENNENTFYTMDHLIGCAAEISEIGNHLSIN